MNSIAVMGTVTRDVIHGEDKSISLMGGIPWFAVEMQNDVKFPMKLVTNIGVDFTATNIPQSMAKRSKLNLLKSPTPVVEIDTRDNNANAKVVGFKNIQIKDIVESNICIISSLFHEISLSTLEEVRKHTKLLIIDIQGFTRPKPNGETILANSLKRQPHSLKRICELVDILKCTEQELSVLLPKLTTEEKIQMMHSWGLQTLLVTQGEKGCWISTRHGEIQKFKTKPVKLNHSVGAGDKFLILLANSLLQKLTIHDAIVKTQKQLRTILMKGNL